ncbi:Sas10/Utp3/C1D family-domain-containing protein [Aspergillus unguis]
MEPADLIPLLERLDDDVDDLEEALQPILESTVVLTSKKLPLMDKAKFHVLVTYALESLIFSYLRLHGVKATEHPVFRELKRVKQYVDKIKALETEPEQRSMVLDKQAAGRFIKHGLAGNDKIDLQREEQLAKEKARAQLKASLLAKKAEGVHEASNNNASSDSDSNADVASGNGSDVKQATASHRASPSESITGKPQKVKKSKKNSGAKDAKKKKHRSKESKEERKNRHKERRKKKEETRKARKET